MGKLNLVFFPSIVVVDWEWLRVSPASHGCGQMSWIGQGLAELDLSQLRWDSSVVPVLTPPQSHCEGKEATEEAALSETSASSCPALPKEALCALGSGFEQAEEGRRKGEPYRHHPHTWDLEGPDVSTGFSSSLCGLSLISGAWTLSIAH